MQSLALVLPQALVALNLKSLMRVQRQAQPCPVLKRPWRPNVLLRRNLVRHSIAGYSVPLQWLICSLLLQDHLGRRLHQRCSLSGLPQP